MTPIWNFIRPHLFYWVLFAGAIFAAHTWLAEHDARLLAEQTVKQSEKTVSDLRSQMESRATAAQTEKQLVIREVAAAKTPAQQIAELPKLADVQLNPEALPDAPSAVKVDLQPLMRQLVTCKENAIELNACQSNLATEGQIESAKDDEIKALGRRPGFWKRLKSDAKKLAIGAAIGGVAVAVAEKRR